MRTTITLDEHLLREAKIIAAASGKTLSEVVEDSLRESLARRSASTPRKRIKLHTFKGDGLMPGVDLNNNADLLDLMEDGVDVNSRR
jgi:hypothetical protein